jgi:hypothetical protein
MVAGEVDNGSIESWGGRRATGVRRDGCALGAFFEAAEWLSC